MSHEKTDQINVVPDCPAAKSNYSWLDDMTTPPVPSRTVLTFHRSYDLKTLGSKLAVVVPAWRKKVVPQVYKQ